MIKKTIFFFLVFKSILLYSSNPLSKDHLTGNFDLGLNFTKNTESTFQFNNISLLKYQKEKSSISLGNNIAFISKTGESELLNKGMQDLRYALNLKKIDINFTLNHVYDISRSIKHRYGTGLGLTYNLTDEDDKKIVDNVLLRLTNHDKRLLQDLITLANELFEEKDVENLPQSDVGLILDPQQRGQINELGYSYSKFC